MNREAPEMSYAQTEQKSSHVADPLNYCIWATIALLSLVLTPFITMAYFGAAGFLKYNKARKAGLTQSRCILKHTWLVQLYLGIIFVAGVGLASLSIGFFVR